jgi:hypothetical protein
LDPRRIKPTASRRLTKLSTLKRETRSRDRAVYLAEQVASRDLCPFAAAAEAIRASHYPSPIRFGRSEYEAKEAMSHSPIECIGIMGSYESLLNQLFKSKMAFTSIDPDQSNRCSASMMVDAV